MSLAPLGHTTSYTYDQLGDVASITAPDGGVTTSTYDTEGDLLSQTGPTGAVTSTTYDYLGRPLTSTQAERYPSSASYTTTSTYGPGGWLASQTSPAGVVTSYGYNPAGETASVTDGAGNVTTTGYDAAGRQTSVTYPDRTQSTQAFDEAGRMTGQADLSAAGTVLRSAGPVYDANGNVLSSTDYRGSTTTFTYDPTGLVASESQPVTGTSPVTTSFGYDLEGNRTLFTDGNGSKWWTTCNPWNLPGSQIEPATTAFPDAPQGTFTASYNAAGQMATITQPGGVTISDTYDAVGNLTGQSGSGADAATATRSYTYDALGRLLTGTSGSGGFTFTYAGAGPQIASDGSWHYSYDPAGTLAGIGPAGGTTAQGVLAFTDIHTDVTGDFTPAGTTLAGQRPTTPTAT